jgi:thymidylate synthase (FAD)
MGSDLTVVNAARVSFGKRTKEWRPDKDDRLLRFLARHKHEIPFAHPHVSFHFKAPIFVARQLAKHQVGFVWSEISRRYVTGSPEFYWPDAWREAAPDKKQGSMATQIRTWPAIMSDYQLVADGCVEAYEVALEGGLAPELARMILPANLYTEWHWTGSLLGWSRVWGLRVKPDAQQETREVVTMIGETMQELFPVAWNVLTER